MTISQCKGIGWALVSVFFWGTMFPVGRFLVAGGRVDPAVLGLLRFAIGGAVLFGAGMLTCRERMFQLRRDDWLRLPFQGLVGAALMALFLFVAQREVPVINASMLEAIVPLQIFVIGLCCGRRGSPLQFTGLMTGFIGCLLVLRILSADGIALKSLKFGDLLIFLSGLCWAVYTVWGREASNRLGGWVFSSWTVLWGAAWLGVYLCFQPGPLRWPSGWISWGWVIYFAIGPTALAFYGWNRAQHYISLALLGLNEYFVPMLAAAFGFLFLGERITPLQLLGSVVIVGAVLIEPDLLPRKPKSPEEPPPGIR